MSCSGLTGTLSSLISRVSDHLRYRRSAGDRLNKAEPGIGDKHFKCEELKAYVEPAERLEAASRQRLVQNCEQAIKAALWDPGSYVFVDHLYVANESNGVDVRLTYLENDGYGGRDQWQTTCSYQL